MRRGSRRHSSDYLEENNELDEIMQEGYEDYDANDTEASCEEEPDEKASSYVWKKIGKIALIILVLIALFFVSMKVTEIFLDRNQEPESYGTDAPAYSESEDEDMPVINDSPEEPEVMEEYKEEDLSTPPSSQKPEETEKPAETDKPVEPEKPAETDKPAETQKPSTPESPSTPSKPIITPGNPAA